MSFCSHRTNTHHHYHGWFVNCGGRRQQQPRDTSWWHPNTDMSSPNGQVLRLAVRATTNIGKQCRQPRQLLYTTHLSHLPSPRPICLNPKCGTTRHRKVNDIRRHSLESSLICGRWTAAIVVATWRDVWICMECVTSLCGMVSQNHSIAFPSSVRPLLHPTLHQSDFCWRRHAVTDGSCHS